MKTSFYIASFIIIMFGLLSSVSSGAGAAVLKIDKLYYRIGFSFLVREAGVWRIDGPEWPFMVSPLQGGNFRENKKTN